MEKFTKNKWILSEVESGDFDVYSEDDNPTHVAFVSAWDAGDEAKYNAALIACAPEMYELLQKLRAHYNFSEYCENEIDALLAKARGEQ